VGIAERPHLCPLEGKAGTADTRHFGNRPSDLKRPRIASWVDSLPRRISSTDLEFMVGGPSKDADYRIHSVQIMAARGLTTIRSSYGPEETMNRFEAEVRARGMIAFAHIDHAAGAAAVGLALRPTELLIFGNARGGTPLMELVQTTGIDLPLRALVWQDASGVTWLSYDDPNWIAKRHGLHSKVGAIVSVLTVALNQMARSATKSP
jgi:uncharacterized protein (DUF302 family)